MLTILVESFQLLILGLETATSLLKKKKTNILCDGHPSVLLHSMKTVVNFIRHLASIHVFFLGLLET